MSTETISIVFTAVTMGVVLGVFKAVDWLISKYRNGKTEPQRFSGVGNDSGVFAVGHWSEVTGEIRPVNIAECKERHRDLAEDIKNTNGKIDRLDKSIEGVEKALIELKQKVGADVELRIRNYSDTSMGNHEKRYHRTRRDTPPRGGYPK